MRKAANLLRFTLVAVAAGALLSGCAEKAEEQVATQTATKTPRRPVDPNLVAAVSDAKTQVRVKVAFELQGKPEVGQPVELRLAGGSPPLEEVDGVLTNYEVSDGLAFSGDWVPLQLAKPEIGKAVDHKIAVVPQRDGIFSVTVTVIVDQNNASNTRSFPCRSLPAPHRQELDEADPAPEGHHADPEGERQRATPRVRPLAPCPSPRASRCGT